MPLRIVDTEGLSHIGRSRKSEALVRQFLISTYLTSSWIIWLDTEVLSTGFFNTMWLVHDYVVDVLQIREGSANSLPGLVYVRTQETDVQKREYSKDFPDFGSFFGRVLEDHEDAPILNQMFAPNRTSGHALPVWTVEDLESFESGKFWEENHDSPFKTAVAELCERLGSPSDVVVEDQVGPPLLALASLSKHLPKIAKLEKFDPRDHEATKVSRLRAQLRAVGFDALRSPLWLADLFDPEDDDVQQHKCCIHSLAKARIAKMCDAMRLEIEVAEADPEVIAVLAQFAQAAEIFKSALDAFAGEEFSEKKILVRAVCNLRWDSSALADELWASFAAAEERFLSATGLSRDCFKDLRLHQRVKWRIEDAVVQIRGCRTSDLHLRKDGARGEFDVTRVWNVGEWSGLIPKRGKASKVHRPEFSLWTDGTAWKLYEEKWLSQRGGDGFTVGELRDQGQAAEHGAVPLPL